MHIGILKNNKTYILGELIKDTLTPYKSDVYKINGDAVLDRGYTHIVYGTKEYSMPYTRKFPRESFPFRARRKRRPQSFCGWYGLYAQRYYYYVLGIAKVTLSPVN